MKKFLRWFMKLFRPDPKGFVRNIQTNSSQGKNTTESFVKSSKKAVLENDLVFWIPAGKIVEIDKNSQGQTTDIHLASGAAFIPVKYSGSFSQTARKQGLSRVTHHLGFKLVESDELSLAAEDLIAKNTKISILHVDRYGDGFFYGEDKGLSIQTFNEHLMVLEGTEDNVFYELTHECLKKVVPKTE